MNILVTGGASGLGASIVKRLASVEGNQVFFTYARSGEAAKEIEANYPNTKGFQCNFTQNESINGFLSQMAEMQLDVLVNNAYGSINKDHFYKTDVNVFRESFEHNVLPTLQITQEAIKGFRKKKFGKIINIISSYTINKPPTGLSDYVANKAYLVSMSKSWASEYIRFNITSNCISPSFMLTGLTADTDERVIEQMLGDHPLKKLLTTDEVADTVAFMTTAPQHMNGTNIIINTGTDLV